LRFIRRENIKRYRKLSCDEKDEAEGRLIQKLLNEAEEGLLTSGATK
jgi:hypothetical protein